MVLKVFPKGDFLGLLICCSQKNSDQVTLKIPLVAISAQYTAQGVNSWMLPDNERESHLSTITKDFVDKYVDISYNSPLGASSSTDMVELYARQILSLGCLYMEFRDAIREGDGLRVLRCYRYLLPIFRSSGRNNYAIETLNFLIQHDYALSERQANELIWSRFINTHGYPGKNIPNDLHCEHLNRLCKTAVKGLGGNKTEKCICRVARAIGTIAPVLDNFDSDNRVSVCSSAHKISSSEKDMRSIVTELSRSAVFSYCPGRSHPSFSKPRIPLHAKSEEEIIDWMKKRIHF